jgi:hypothetical protein
MPAVQRVCSPGGVPEPGGDGEAPGEGGAVVVEPGEVVVELLPVVPDDLLDGTAPVCCPVSLG